MSSVLERAAAFDRDHTRTTRAAGGHEWTYYRGGEGPAVLLLPGGFGESAAPITVRLTRFGFGRC